MPRKSEAPSPRPSPIAPLVSIRPESHIRLSGELRSPNSRNLAVGWRTSDGENGELGITIDGIEPNDEKRSVCAIFETNDRRVIRSLGLLLIQLAERVESAEFDGRDER